MVIESSLAIGIHDLDFLLDITYFIPKFAFLVLSNLYRCLVKVYDDERQVN